MMSDVLKAAKRAHAKSPLEPLPREPEEDEEVCIALGSGNTGSQCKEVMVLNLMNE